MQAGKLRHRLTLQRQTVTRDSFGGEVVTWVDVATVWGAVEPVAGTETFQQVGEQVLAVAYVKVRVRYRGGITAKMRFIFNSRILDIEHVANLDTRNWEINLLCREVPDG